MKAQTGEQLFWVLVLSAYGLIFLSGCQDDLGRSRAFNERLSKIIPESYFSLDTLEARDWDKCYILTPYQNADTLLSTLRGVDKKKIGDYLISDGYNLLLFTKENVLTDMKVLSRNVMDFSKMTDKTSFTPDNILRINRNREVVEIKDRFSSEDDLMVGT